MSKTQEEFIAEHDGDLTPEQSAHMLTLPRGDTDDESSSEKTEQPGSDTGSDEEDDGEPQATDTDKTENENGEQDQQVDEEKLTSENAVIMAKDGKHTISFDKLLDARKGEQYWREQAEASKAELAQLQAKAEEQAKAGLDTTQIDAQVADAKAAVEEDQNVEELFGDFSEEALASGIQNLVKSQVSVRLKEALAQELEPFQQKQALDETQAHYQTIYEAHPDADSIAESKELSDWIESQPKFLQNAYAATMQGGSAQDVVDLFSTFKQATGATQQAEQPAQDPEKVKAAAKKAIASAPASVPDTLTDIPGGRASAVDRFERLAQITDGRDAVRELDKMSPDERERYLNSL